MCDGTDRGPPSRSRTPVTYAPVTTLPFPRDPSAPSSPSTRTKESTNLQPPIPDEGRVPPRSTQDLVRHVVQGLASPLRAGEGRGGLGSSQGGSGGGGGTARLVAKVMRRVGRRRWSGRRHSPVTGAAGVMAMRRVGCKAREEGEEGRRWREEGKVKRKGDEACGREEQPRFQEVLPAHKYSAPAGDRSSTARRPPRFFTRHLLVSDLLLPVFIDLISLVPSQRKPSRAADAPFVYFLATRLARFGKFVLELRANS